MRGFPAEARDQDAPRAVYGVVLNFRNELAALGEAVNAQPYNQPPRTPILYIAGYTVANDYAVRDYLENYYFHCGR